MKNNLAVCETHVYCALHCFEIVLAFRTVEWRAREFAVENFDTVFWFHDAEETRDIVGCDLMAKTSAATVKHDNDLVRMYPPSLCYFFVVNVFFRDVLNFKIMVS